MRTLRRLLTASAVTLAAASCGVGGGDGGEVLDNVHERAVAGVTDLPYSSFVNLADQTETRHDDPSFVRNGGAEIVVLGRFTEVSPGKAFSWSADEVGREIRNELPFTSESAMVRTYHLVFEVDEVVAPKHHTTYAGESIVVGLALDADVDVGAVRTDYLDLPPSVLFLNHSAVFDYDGDVWAILGDGSLMLTVQDDGEGVRFPTMKEPEALLDGATRLTVDDLRR